MSSIAQAYLDGDAFVRSLFERPMAPACDGTQHAWSGSIAAACRSYSGALGVDRALPSGSAVITGQQTGLLGGPLYTVLKAITAVQLAERLSRESGRPCTPVFWLAGDDHDFDEVRTVTILTKRNEPVALTWNPRGEIANRSMYRLPLDDRLDAIIDAAAEAAYGSEWREPVLQFLKESRGQYDNLCDWTGAILARLFQDTPLVFFAPHLAPARREAMPVIAREIEDPLASTRLLIAAGEALAAAGHEIPLPKKADQCLFFVERAGVRHAVRYRGDQFHLGNGESFTPTQLRRLLDEDPGAFSAGAALRPVVQQALFPTAAYVAGPGEIAYWAQLKPLFQRHDLPMPSVYPRARAVLLSQKDRQRLDGLGWTPMELQQPLADLIERALATEAASPAIPLLSEHRTRVSDAILAAARDLNDDAVAREMVQRLAARTNRGFDRIERAVLHEDRQQVEAIRTRVTQLQTRLAPNRKPQERVYSSVSWLFEHGWEFERRVSGQVRLDTHGLQEIIL